MKRLATILDKGINVVKGLSNEESNLIMKHIEQVHALRRKVLQFQQILNIFQDIKVTITNNPQNLSRLISEMLSNFRAFLDYWETSLKKEFNKNSIQVQSFKKATSFEYDNMFDYRFVYELRNYIQHCGMPNFLVKSILDINENKIYEVALNPKELLNNFNWKPSVRKDLENRKTMINLLETFSNMIKSVERINNIALNCYDIKDCIKSCSFILSYEKYRIEKSTLAIIEFPKGYPEKLDGKLSVQELPFALAKHFIEQINIYER
ncbi:hypothetical protein [uncultured Draconibacterium sp.]|uniref:hypothetical protein n=1 Tax=uncultured Draconibacterium sp. TaxID=1573823 RepID=UPI0029C8FEF6|nr:hypothetical protein [uncultured Draconibacterium sp.]